MQGRREGGRGERCPGTAEQGTLKIYWCKIDELKI